jgi:hypothetical protein
MLGLEVVCANGVTGLVQLSAMVSARFREPLDHRHQESTVAAGGLNRHEPSKVPIRRIASEVENEFNDPAPREDRAMFRVVGFDWW